MTLTQIDKENKEGYKVVVGHHEGNKIELKLEKDGLNLKKNRKSN